MSPLIMMLPWWFILTYWIEYHIEYEHNDLFDIVDVSQLHMIYIYVCLCWAWTLKHMIDEMFCFEQGALENMGKLMFCVEREALEHLGTYICVEWEAMKHMIFETFLLSLKLWNTWKDNLEVLGIILVALHVDVEHKIWNIRSLAIVSLDVSCKFILALVFTKDLWHCTKFVTPYF